MNSSSIHKHNVFQLETAVPNVQIQKVKINYLLLSWVCLPMFMPSLSVTVTAHLLDRTPSDK